jgi:hypothetical protein
MFQNLLDRFVAAVGRHDSAGLAALFTEDGLYDDYFFGVHQGRPEIAAMLDRFHVGGEQFVWEFLEPVCDGRLGYARYCFSYLSREPESAGQPVVFEGMSRFQLREGQIARYSEVFDRAVAFTQLGYAPERVVKLMGRYTRGFRDEAAVQSHLARRDAIATAWRR